MRPGLSLALGAAVTVAVAGCSLIASFDDPPDAGLAGDDDGFDSGFGSSSGTTSSSSSSSGSSGTTTSSSSSSSSSSGTAHVDAGTTFPPACDTTVTLANIDCNGNTKLVCGTHVIGGNGTDIADDDLITCDGNGNATCVQHCSMGCADLGTQFTSQCANCTKGAGVGDNWYCGKDTLWTTADHDVAYECKNGLLVKGSPAGCGMNLCHTNCNRTSPPPLPGSCCEGTPDN